MSLCEAAVFNGEQPFDERFGNISIDPTLNCCWRATTPKWYNDHAQWLGIFQCNKKKPVTENDRTIKPVHVNTNTTNQGDTSLTRNSNFYWNRKTVLHGDHNFSPLRTKKQKHELLLLAEESHSHNFIYPIKAFHNTDCSEMKFALHLLYKTIQSCADVENSK